MTFTLFVITKGRIEEIGTFFYLRHRFSLKTM